MPLAVLPAGADMLCKAACHQVAQHLRAEPCSPKGRGLRRLGKLLSGSSEDHLSRTGRPEAETAQFCLNSVFIHSPVTDGDPEPQESELGWVTGEQQLEPGLEQEAGVQGKATATCAGGKRRGQGPLTAVRLSPQERQGAAEEPAGEPGDQVPGLAWPPSRRPPPSRPAGQPARSQPEPPRVTQFHLAVFPIFL